jgi:hypothetical protein
MLCCWPTSTSKMSNTKLATDSPPPPQITLQPPTLLFTLMPAAFPLSKLETATFAECAYRTTQPHPTKKFFAKMLRGMFYQPRMTVLFSHRDPNTNEQIYTKYEDGDKSIAPLNNGEYKIILIKGKVIIYYNYTK